MVRLERLPGPAVVVRDDLGTPCIWASSPEAGFFAMGYTHAQDRLWQLELMRRAAWGELARVAGEDAFPLDILHRRIGFYRHAIGLRNHLGEEETLLRAYSLGITAYLRAHPTRLPPEFLAARLRPALWQVEDVLAIGALNEWLALPCSLRAKGIPSAFDVGDRSFDLASLPSGLRTFLFPIEVEAFSRGGAVRFELAWGSQTPQPWVETGLVVGNGAFRRGWCIPGWPIAQVMATDEGLFSQESPTTDPWRTVSTQGWRPVLEFLLDSPDGACDTVLVSAHASAVSPTGTEGMWWATDGSSRFEPLAIRRGLSAWVDPRPDIEDSTGAWHDVDQSWTTGQNHPAEPSAHGEMMLEPIVPFRLLDCLPGTPTTVRGPGRLAGCGMVVPQMRVPLAVVVQWEQGRVSASLMLGQSGVAGTRHRRDQHRAWSREVLLPRDMRFPDFSRGCSLVPLLS